MLLSDRGLRAAVAAGELAIEPFDPSRIQPCSIDLTLDHRFRVFRNHRRAFIDPKVDMRDMTELVEIGDEQPFMLHPDEFVLAATAEVVTLGDAVAARVEGKSSLGRLGLLVHATAGFIDAGFSGQVTLELANLTPLPIALYPGMPIGQLCVFQMDQPTERPYSLTGKYHGQTGPTASEYFRNFT